MKAKDIQIMELEAECDKLATSEKALQDHTNYLKIYYEDKLQALNDASVSLPHSATRSGLGLAPTEEADLRDQVK